MPTPNEHKRFTEAKATYQAGLARVKTAKPNNRQKFQIGDRVHIAKDLGPHMSHFESDMDATVEYTYAQAYGGDNYTSYSLDIDGEGSIAWYHEEQLTLIP